MKKVSDEDLEYDGMKRGVNVEERKRGFCRVGLVLGQVII